MKITLYPLSKERSFKLSNLLFRINEVDLFNDWHLDHLETIGVCMKMLSFISLFSLSLLLACASKVTDKKITTSPLPTETSPDLIKVAEFRGAQVTGVTVDDSGRIFANFPRWRDNLLYSVVEVGANGEITPYPNKEWNTWKGKPTKNSFTCVQSVIAHGNSLFVLDPASPKMEGVVGEPKLYEFNLETNVLTRTFSFNRTAAPKNSYLNDFRIDDKNGKVYITDSGIGGIVVLDLLSGNSRRVLDTHASTKAESVTLLVNGKPFLMKGRAPRIHSDGIALSDDGKYLYYHALTGYHLYRVPTQILNDPHVSPSVLASHVENFGFTPAPDGMMFDTKGNLYMADLERNAVAYRTPEGSMQILIQDERIQWPDTFALDQKNNLIFTDSLLQRAPAGAPADDLTFTIYKVALPQKNIH
jgi:sugar lactone lactonase YvrE